MAINVLLKRSTTASKRPTAAQLDIGELSLNYDANTAGVFFEDSAGNVRKVGPAEVSATAPNASPAGSSGNSLGELWYDTSTSSLKVWTGSSFVAATGAGAAGGSNTQVQFNSTGVLAGSSNFTFDGTTVSTAGLAVTGSSIFRAAATQDGVAIVGRAGGTSSYEVTFTPTTLTADRIQTLQDAAGTVALGANNLSFFAATTSAQLAGVISDETGSGALVFATSPTLVTPVLGVASATSVNKVAITTPATSATLTIADGKTLTASNTLTFTGTDTSSVAFGTGGTVAYTANKLSVFAATTSSELAGVISDETGSGALVFATSPTFVTPVLGVATGTSFNSITGLSSTNPAALGAVAVGTGTTTARADHVHPTTGLGLTSGTLAQFAATTSSQLAGVISDETGSGALVFATSPTLTTPALGVATATSVNKVAITAPATSATLTIADGKTLTASNTLTFTGTDTSSVAFGAGGTVAYTANKLSVFAATTSAELAGVISDETGSGALVFATSPSLTTPAIGAATGTSLSLTGDITIGDKIIHAGDTNTSIRFPAADTVSIETAGSERARIDSSGNVGIGTTDPAFPLEVVSTSAADVSTALQIRNSDNGVGTASKLKLITSTSSTANVGVHLVAERTTIGGSADFVVQPAGIERLRLTQNGTLTIAASAAVAPFVATIASSEVARIDSSGRLLVGTSSDVGGGDLIQSDTSIAAFRGNTAANNSPILKVLRSRGSTFSLSDAVINNDSLGRILFQGADGTSLVSAAQIEGEVDGTPGPNDMPGRLVFSTTADGASSPTERMRIDSAGNVGIGTGSLTVRAAATQDGVILTGRAGGTSSYEVTITPTTLSADRTLTLANGDTTLQAGTMATTGGTLAQFAATTSSQLAGVISDETGSGALVFATSPTLTTPAIGAATGTSLSLSGNITIGDKIIHAGDTDTAIRFPAADTVTIETSGSEKVRITSFGNLFVGTTSAVSVNGLTAGFELHALGTTNGASASIVRFNDDSVGPQLNFGKSRNGATLSPGTVVQNNDALGDISFCGDDGTDINSRAARIACEVDGTPGPNDMPGRLIFSTTPDGAAFAAERLRITSGGDINIGTGGGTISPASSTAVGAGLSITDDGGILSKTTQAIGSVFFEQNIIGYTSGTAVYQRFRVGGGVIGSITTTNGTSTAYNTSSDYRLKENITLLDGAIARLNQLPVHRFNFIANPNSLVDGFLAHEAAAVVPECVTGEKDEVDEDGNPVYQGIDQSKIVPLLTAALQEAISEIESLKARLTAAGI